MPHKDRERRRKYQAAYHQKHRAGLNGIDHPPGESNPTPVEPVPLRNAADALAILAAEVNKVRSYADADPLNSARTIGYLVATALKALEIANLDARLEAIERVLKLRSGVG